MIGHEFEFHPDDPIFCLHEPNENPSQSPDPFCSCCKEKYKSAKDSKSCDFCGLAFCSKCRYKERVFPASPNEETGDICKVCDRKFFIKSMLREKQNEIDLLSQQLLGIGGLHEQIEKSRKEIHKLQKEFNRTKEIYYLDY